MRRLHATGPFTVRHHPRARLRAGLSVLGAALGALGLAACGEPTSLGDVTSDPSTGGTESSPTEEGGANSGEGGADSDPGGGAAETGGTTGNAGAPASDAGAPASDELPDVFEPEAQARSDQLDLLFVIDNSISMADKQQLLREAVPKLVERLLDPQCRGLAGGLTPKDGGQCPAGTVEDFSPVQDMHIGVISSSLGGHGGIACTAAEGSTFVPAKDDRGELIAELRGLATYEQRGFLAWDTRPNPLSGTSDNLATLVSDLESVLMAAGESGCGYEAPLEAMYRFLVDPEPPIQVLNNTSESVRDGINSTLLAQREAFLRPDSALTIVMLTDENDCSVLDEGPGMYVAGVTAGGKLPRATAACASDPNDPCCRSCALSEAEPPDGCAPLNADPGCPPTTTPLAGAEDHENLRCFEQKRRFGLDLLYPTERYVRGLTRPTIVRDRDHAEVENPLFARGRDPSLVTLVGIVGVPWQLLARSQSEDLPLRFKPAAQLHAEGLWPAIVGRPATHEPPLDPFMVESIEPRTDLEPSPVTGLAPENPDAAAGASPVNGHEYVVTDGGDLQYACTYQLDYPRTCVNEVTGGCDCRESDLNLATKPLCQAPGSTAMGTTQYSAKAYPGLRQLEVMRRLGPLAVPASICPRVTDDPSDPSYGYNPVTESMLDRLRGPLGGVVR